MTCARLACRFGETTWRVRTSPAGCTRSVAVVLPSRLARGLIIRQPTWKQIPCPNRPRRPRRRRALFCSWTTSRRCFTWWLTCWNDRDGASSALLTVAPRSSLYARKRPDFVVLDVAMPGLSGLQVLEILKSRDPDATIVMLTGGGDIATAVEAMRAGAENFLTKPWQTEHLVAVAQRAFEKSELKRLNRVLGVRQVRQTSLATLGQSPVMRELARNIELARGRERADSADRRDGRRQGLGVEADSRGLAAQRGAVRVDQLRGADVDVPGFGTLRARKGCVYRREDPETRACSRSPTAEPCYSTRSVTSRPGTATQAAHRARDAAVPPPRRDA